MDLRINQSESEGISVLHLRGRVVFGESEASLRDCIFRLQDARAFRVVLNMQETYEVDLDGVDAIKLCGANLRDAGGALKLLSPCAAKLDSNTFLTLETNFEVFTDLQDAIDSFFPDRAVPQFDILTFAKGLKKHPLPDAS